MRLVLGNAGVAAFVLGLAICLGGPPPALANPGTPAATGAATLGDPPPPSSIRASAKIVAPSRPLQCVPYARTASGILIYGDAWTWWNAAKGRFARGHAPRPGAVLVMKKTKRLKRGHLAVVRRVVDSRTIIVDQANWLNRGRIHLNSAVRDVSAKNDWSAVRVWYTPGARYGSRTYGAQGFIYTKTPALKTPAPKTPAPKIHAIRQASLDRVPVPRRRPEGVRLVHFEPVPASAKPRDHDPSARPAAGQRPLRAELGSRRG